MKTRALTNENKKHKWIHLGIYVGKINQCPFFVKYQNNLNKMIVMYEKAKNDKEL